MQEMFDAARSALFFIALWAGVFWLMLCVLVTSGVILRLALELIGPDDDDDKGAHRAH